MGFATEFREFALKGNVMDLAIGVIIGAAFGRIIDSIVKDLIMPVIGVFFSADFSNLYIPLGGEVPKGLPLEEARNLGPVFAWGNFITVLINFIILAFVIFLMVRAINKMRRKKENKADAIQAPENTLQEKLLMEIRDSLSKR
ncbi:MAG: large conductance mechanosensitive channel protein MscL [Flavisolibacter sp.]|jgi:large conductance mechanosensitive channel|nr:large conductance mechanosensitive channel protein MscL [Flavisolibacter sp.]